MTRLKLRWKLGIAVGMLIFALAATLTYFSVQWQKNRWLEQAKEKNFLIANSLKHHTEDYLGDGELSSSEKKHMLSYLHSLNQDFIFFRVVDGNGKILLSIDSQGAVSHFCLLMG